MVKMLQIQPIIDQHRMDYSPVFLERRVVIQALYDNLQDKSRVHTSRGVTGVSILTDGVQVTTSDGGLYVGEILIGADGIHSTVRREMWRLSNEQQPCYVTQEEQERTTTTYCCMFGISNHRQGFPEHETQHVQGEGHSYLLSTGPENDVYWFLFKKLARPAYGLYDDIPRYTEMQRAALAEEHANDRLSKGLSFGDLYQARRTATLQALPEIEFSKWHWSRVMTIGDAAHKASFAGHLKHMAASLTASSSTLSVGKAVIAPSKMPHVLRISYTDWNDRVTSGRDLPSMPSSRRRRSCVTQG